MDLDRGFGDEPDRESPRGAGSSTIIVPTALSTDETSPIMPDRSTPLLRRCTALAARARVDLLTTSQHAAADELERVLATLESWDPQDVVDPDPTMVVLAAASLQDLAQRLPETSDSTLGTRVAAVLLLLHSLMQRVRIDAMA